MVTHPSTPTGQILESSLFMLTRLDQCYLEWLITKVIFGLGLAMGKPFFSFLREGLSVAF